MTSDLLSEFDGGYFYKYGSEWINHLESKLHWEFYWYQQKIMEDFLEKDQERSILEIGVGSGFTANYCRGKGFNVTTLDIDPGKKPDIIANAATYEILDQYDYLMAFEVFEHMPFSEFEKILHRVPKFIKRYVFMSLPRNERVLLSLNIAVSKLKPLNFAWRVPAGRITTEAHYWELNYKKYSTERVEKLFSKAGLELRKIMKYQHINFYALEVVK